MSQLGIFGIGSPFGDDQVGWRVIALLRRYPDIASYISQNRLRLEICDRPGTTLLEHLQDVKQAWLIDAVITGAPIGSIHEFPQASIEQVSRATSTHGLELSYTLQLGRALNLLPPDLYLYGVEIAAPPHTHFVESPLSEHMHRAARQLAILLRKQVKCLLKLSHSAAPSTA